MLFWRTPEDLISASFRLKIGHFETSTTETDHIIIKKEAFWREQFRQLSYLPMLPVDKK